jgi:myo-inositol-1(or 4)-monophosphatase
MEIQRFLDHAIRAASAGATAIREASQHPREVTAKGFRDYVTNADFASQKAILSVIQTSFPDHLILTEESAEAKNLAAWRVPDGYWWIIDPLDGTTNFQLGNPIHCVSVALAHGDQLLAGALVESQRETVFAAGLGVGATLNGQPIQVSTRAELIEAVASCDWPRSPGLRKLAFETAGRFGNACRTFRSIGSAALGIAYVAAGWTDIYVHQSIAPWDCAAAALIVREAGGVVCRHSGEAWSIMDADFIATTPALKDAAAQLAQG